MGNVPKEINANVTQVLVEHAVSKVGLINRVTRTVNTVTMAVKTSYKRSIKIVPEDKYIISAG